MAVFRQRVHLSRRKSATKSLYVKTVSDKVVRHSLAHLSVQKIVAGGRLTLPENLAERDPPLQKRRFPIDIRSYRLNRNT